MSTTKTHNTLKYLNYNQFTETKTNSVNFVINKNCFRDWKFDFNVNLLDDVDVAERKLSLQYLFL